MAKAKEVTEQEINDAIAPLDEVSSALLGMERRICNGHLAKINNPIEIARTLIANARTLNEFALRMLTRHDLNMMREQTEAMI